MSIFEPMFESLNEWVSMFTVSILALLRHDHATYF
jgi:hypothetical protein